MPIFELTKDKIVEVPQTTFAVQGVKERYDLQKVLRENISSIVSDLYVLAEEFGGWEEVKRRIDLLCLDKDANLVVVELKRSEDGGHMELQAIRYAAMVSAMTFEQAVEAHAAYLRSIGADDDDSEARILQFLEWDEPQNHEFAQNTRIILVSSEFSKELTTSVLWLCECGLDIRCIRLRPYSFQERVLLDIQQVIPLPEAAQYQVQLRKKAAEQREAQAQGTDWRYDLKIKNVVSPNLCKRKLMYLAVGALIKSGVSPEQIDDVFPQKKFLKVSGSCSADEFEAKVSQMRNTNGGMYDVQRYYAEQDELFRVNGDTYALTNQWSRKRPSGLDQLIAKYPEAGLSYVKASNE